MPRLGSIPQDRAPLSQNAEGICRASPTLLEALADRALGESWVPNRRLVQRTAMSELTVKHGPYAANHAMRTFRVLYNQALREDPTLPPNPTSAVVFNKETRRNWALAKATLPSWWARVQTITPIVRDLHLFLLFTGLRRTDACTAKWEHWDEAQGTLFIPTPKGGEARGFALPLSTFLTQLFHTRRHENDILFTDSPWVFPALSTSGHVEEPKRVGLPAPHAYRHTYRTLSLEAGIPYTEVSLLLNHKVQTVSYGYISRSVVLAHLKEQQETMTAYLLHALQPETYPSTNGQTHRSPRPNVAESFHALLTPPSTRPTV